jgi:predicted ATPase/DNA-binding XRE family transcriptional regulator
MEQPARFGPWLKQQRRLRHLTQEQLAERLACSSVLIQKVEAGERTASAQLASLIADWLEVSPTDRKAFASFARGQLGSHEAETRFGYASSTLPAAGYLPHSLTPLIGRAGEVEKLEGMLSSPEVRLLTLTGPPGIGKTRLALEVANRVKERFADGAYLVALASVVDPDLVPATIARTLGTPEKSRESPLEALQRALGTRQMLLVLDNFEQVLDAAPAIVDLLAASPGLKVLLTSREGLYVFGEQQFHVPALDVADPANLPPLRALETIPAVALFLERARAVDHDFALTEQNAIPVATVCARLDGLPLAIELAAARIRHFSPQEMQARLGEPVAWLTGGPRNLPARQRTLRAAIDWSYNLLGPEEQTLFARLGVFTGGFTADAAQAVCGDADAPARAVREGMVSLLDKSLLKREEGADGESSYSMLETLRDYALERLHTWGALSALRERHARYYLGIAQEASAKLDGEEQLTWLARLEQAYENIRAAIDWSIYEEVGATTALGFAAALHSFWLRSGYVTDARTFLSGALARAGHVKSAEKAKALYVAGRFAAIQGEHANGQNLIRQSLDLYRELGDRTGISLVLRRMGTEYLVHRTGDPREARQALEEALTIARETGDPEQISEALGHVANFITELGNYRDALPLFEESLALARQIGDKGLVGSVLLSLGDIARFEGELDRASAIFEECVVLFEASGVKMGRAFALLNLAHVALSRGDLGTVGQLATESMAFFEQAGHKRALAECIVTFAGLYLAKGDLRRAITLFGYIRAAIDRDEAVLPKLEQIEFEQRLAQASALADDATWSTAWTGGTCMTTEQAIECALKQA